MDQSSGQQCPLNSIPSEIIVKILANLNTHQDVLNAGLAAMSFQSCIGANEIWKSLSLSRWKHVVFDLKHANDPSWIAFYKRHHADDLKTDKLVNNMIYRDDTSNYGRAPHIRILQSPLFECKDRLLHHIRTPDDAPDCLSRRYWARYLLKSSQRAHGLSTLIGIRTAGLTSGWAYQPHHLESGLVAVDLFLRDGEEGDHRWMSARLDRMAQDFRNWLPEFESLSTRAKATNLANFMIQQEGFAGNPGLVDFDVADNFIGLTLEDSPRSGTPLIYVAIFCCLASRLGIDARPIKYPIHVFAVVFPPVGVNLDGNHRHPDVPSDRMYLDVFTEQYVVEVPEGRLLSILHKKGLASQSQAIMTPAHVFALIKLQRQFIDSTRGAVHVQDEDPDEHQDRHGLWSTNRRDLWYLLLCLDMIIEDPTPVAISYGGLIFKDYRDFPEDVYLFNDIFGGPVDGNHQVRQTLFNKWIAEEGRLPIPKPRTAQIAGRVLHKVGTYFQHNRYRYTGFVIGWDVTYQRHPLDDNLGNADHQSFYHVL
jgi:F-box protein 21